MYIGHNSYFFLGYSMSTTLNSLHSLEPEDSACYQAPQSSLEPRGPAIGPEPGPPARLQDE